MNEKRDRERKTSIDELNEQLYYKKDGFKQRPRRKIHDEHVSLNHDFEHDNLESLKKEARTPKLPTSFFKKIFFVVLGIFMITALAAVINFSLGRSTVSSELISLDILGQTLVDGGDDLQLQVRIQNFNEQALELPDLILSYPKDSREDSERVFMRRSLENIEQGNRAIEEFTVILFGEEGETREVDARLEYRINNSNAIFVKETNHEVIIRSTPTTLTLDAPEEIVRGQVFEMDINLSSNSNMVVSNTLLELEYPDGFEFISATPEPTAFNRVWAFPFLNQEIETVTVRGRLSAFEGQGQSFGINFGRQNIQRRNEIETYLNRLVHTVDVEQPFITTTLNLNGSTDDQVSIRGGEEIDGEITYINTTDDVLQDVSIVLNLDGDLYNPVGIRAQNGFFNSNTGTINWDTTTSSRFELLEPGQERTVSFTLPTQDLVGRTGALTNPRMNMTVDVRASEINGNNRQALSVSQAEVRANSDVEVIAKVQHDEGPFTNSGPMPPRVGNTTTYTVTLDITNSSNSVSDAELRLFLPPYVRWLNAVAPSVERNAVEYNEVNRELLWNLNTLRSGLGVNGSTPRTLFFQVEVLPSLSQVGDQVTLTSDINLTGVDDFTDVNLSFRKTALENRITNSQEPGADGRIRN